MAVTGRVISFRTGTGLSTFGRVQKTSSPIENSRAWVKCLGNVSRVEAEMLAHGLAYEHGKRILALRALAKGEPHTADTRSREAAERHIELALPKDEPAPSPNLRDGRRPHLMRLVDLWERRKSPRSQIGLARTRLCVRRFIELVGDLEPHEVTRAHVIAYRDELENLPRMKSANIAEHLCKMHGLVQSGPQ